jgi:hypothetical protein
MIIMIWYGVAADTEQADENNSMIWYARVRQDTTWQYDQ